MTTTIHRPSSATGLFGQNEIRAEGRDKVNGMMQFTADIYRPNMLWAAYTKSPHAFARIKNIDTSAAKQVPGVRAVLTWHDIGEKRIGRQIFDWPVLCYDVVRFIGDRVAAIAAETRDAAEEAARLVEVEYEELDPILTAADAVRPSALALHPEFENYHYLAYIGNPKPRRPHPNLQSQVVIEKGEFDREKIFASAYRVFEHVFETPRQHCGYIEPHATLVWIDEDDTVHVQSPNKAPFALRTQLAHVTGIPPEKIVIETSAIGGDFGGKGLTIDEFPCYFLAKATGRPVRHVHLYAEELQRINVRHPATLRLRTAVDAKGTFLAHDAHMLYNGGAYGAAKPTANLLQGIGFGSVPYHIPNSKLTISCAYTNTVPSGHMRSPADVQTFFGWEQHVDLIAHGLGIDPLDVRMLNVIRDGQVALTDEMMPNPAGYDVLQKLKEESNYGERLPAGRARGIALACRHTGQGTADIKLTLNPDGTFLALTGAPDQGSGGHTVIRRVIAATLGVSLEKVAVRRATTKDSPLDPGTGASRVTHVQGSAARVAAEKLKVALEDLSGLRLEDDRFVSVAGGPGENIEAVAHELCANGPIDAVGHYNGEHHARHVPGDFSFSAFSIEVEVDVHTGALTVRDALLIADVGQIINPVGHAGQLEGGFIYGLGGALMEEMPVDESGKLATPSLAEYKMPTMKDIVPFRAVLVPGAPGHGPYGAKMAGELSNSGVAPAIANAIYNAVGVRLYEFPITAERVYEALLAKQERVA